MLHDHFHLFLLGVLKACVLALLCFDAVYVLSSFLCCTAIVLGSMLYLVACLLECRL